MGKGGHRGGGHSSSSHSSSGGYRSYNYGGRRTSKSDVVIHLIVIYILIAWNRTVWLVEIASKHTITMDIHETRRLNLINHFQSILFNGITIEDTSGQVNIYQADEEATVNTENYEHTSHSETASLSSGDYLYFAYYLNIGSVINLEVRCDSSNGINYYVETSNLWFPAVNAYSSDNRTETNTYIVPKTDTYYIFFLNNNFVSTEFSLAFSLDETELELQDTDLVCPAGTASCAIDFNIFKDTFIYLQAPYTNDDDYGTRQLFSLLRDVSTGGIDSDSGSFLTRETRGDLGVEVELDTADDETGANEIDLAENDDDGEVTYSVSYYGHVNWTFAILLAYIIIPVVLVGVPCLLIYMCVYCTTKREAHLRLLDTPPVSTSAHVIVTRPEIKATAAVTGYSTIEETPLLHGEDHIDDCNTYPTATIFAVPYQASPAYGDAPYPMYINPNNRAPAFGDPDEPYIS